MFSSGTMMGVRHGKMGVACLLIGFCLSVDIHGTCIVVQTLEDKGDDVMIWGSDTRRM
jgi:hypothetical protein